MKSLMIKYTNWKGETRDRAIIPIKVFYGTTQYHPELQWLLEAEDVEKGEVRIFAMASIHLMRNEE